MYETTNGGARWNNITETEIGSLPDVPANTVVFEGGPSNGVYVGMDVGVYYRNDNMRQWMLHSKGLPMVIVCDLIIPPGSNRLIAATFGRGVWETTLIEGSSD